VAAMDGPLQSTPGDGERLAGPVRGSAVVAARATPIESRLIEEVIMPIRFFLVVCALCLAAVPALADWPLFRGNALQTGVSKETLPDTLELLWKIKVKDGIESTAAIVDGTVYFGAFDDHIHAVSLADGSEKWKLKVGAGVKAPVSYRDGMIYVGDEDGMFHC